MAIPTLPRPRKEVISPMHAKLYAEPLEYKARHSYQNYCLYPKHASGIGQFPGASGANGWSLLRNRTQVPVWKGEHVLRSFLSRKLFLHIPHLLLYLDTINTLISDQAHRLVHR